MGKYELLIFGQFCEFHIGNMRCCLLRLTVLKTAMIGKDINAKRSRKSILLLYLKR